MLKTVCLIGVPGSGKTTLFRSVLSYFPSRAYFASGLLKGECWHENNKPFYVFGTYQGTVFDGTDRLSMAVQPDAEKFMRSASGSVILFEGDRLGNQSFLSLAAELGELKVFCLQNPEETVLQRRLFRGSKQSEIWLKGRASKVRALCEKTGATFLSTASTEMAEASIKKILSEIRPL